MGLPATHELYSFRAAIQALRRSITIERVAFAALLILAVTFPIEALRAPVIIGNEAFTNVTLLQYVVIGLWLAHHFLAFQKPDNWRRLPVGLTVAIGLWVALLWVSAFFAPDFRDKALPFDGHILLGILLAWVTYDLTRSSERWLLLLRCFAFGGIIVYGFGLAEVAPIPPIQNGLVALRGASIYAGELLRLSSTLSYPNIAAVIIELTLFPLLAWAISARRLWVRLWLGFSLLAGLMALVLTYSRGGLAAFFISLLIVAVLVLYYQRFQRERRSIILGGIAVIGGLAIVGGLLAIANPIIALRFITQDDQSWYQAAYSVSDQVTSQPGSTLAIPVTVTNTGQLTWRAGGDQPFYLSYHFFRINPTSRQGLQYEGVRTPLPNDIPPGQSVSVLASVSTPTESGDYLIEWDMVQEGITWFSTKGGLTADTKLSLVGESVSDAPVFDIVPFNDVPPQPSPGRLTLWTIALQIFQAHPLLGIGPDNFRRVYGSYLGLAMWNTDIHANNVYFEWLADTGIAGLLAFLAMSLMLARLAWQRLKQPADPLWVWHLALIGSLLAWYIHGFVDYFYEFTPANVAFWLLVGLIAASVNGQTEASPRSQQS